MVRRNAKLAKLRQLFHDLREASGATTKQGVGMLRRKKLARSLRASRKKIRGVRAVLAHVRSYGL